MPPGPLEPLGPLGPLGSLGSLHFTSLQAGPLPWGWATSLLTLVIEWQETYAMYFINFLMMSVKLHNINNDVTAYLNYTIVTVGMWRPCRAVPTRVVPLVRLEEAVEAGRGHVGGVHRLVLS